MNNDMQKFLLQSIVFECPSCKGALSCTLADLGKEKECKNCKEIIKIGKRIKIDEDFAGEFPEIASAAIELQGKL